MQIEGGSDFRSLSPQYSQTEIRSAFQESLELISATLEREYLMEASEAERIEEDLYRWLERFCQRPGSPAPRECRHSLLLMACLFARVHQQDRIRAGLRESDDRLKRVLRREPLEVARDVSRGLKILYRRLHEA